MCEQVTDFSRRFRVYYNVGGGASDSRVHLIGQKSWWEAEVQSDVIKIIDPYWWKWETWNVF